MTTDTDVKTDKVEKHGFQAEVSRLLHMMVHSVYSEREIFLRELISNASDACDKLRYEALTTPDLLKEDPELQVSLTLDEKAGTLTLSDNGIGMSHDELISHLGTIARSGTSAFMEQMAQKSDGKDKKDAGSMIGQFGVGFYSVFMVSENIEVTSRRAGADESWTWHSDGIGEYTLAPAAKATRGTDIVIHIKDDAKEFLDEHRLRNIIKTYSDHIALPITLVMDKDGEQKSERVNEGKALWTRPKSEITEDQYKEFYHHVGHAMDDPWMTLHYKAEGVLEYTVLMYVPSQPPMDLFDPARKSRSKLYVKRVFITDDCEDLIPGYLRFMRGIVDSQDLPLNISREMLQNNPVLAKIQSAVTKKILSELEKKAKKDPEAYATFWKSFGPVLKEGIYEDFSRRDQLMKLARFETTADKGLSSFDDYIARMKEGQETIYYITGDNINVAKRSPQLEGFRAKGIEVLYLTDAVDDFWLQMVPEYDGKKFQSVTKGVADLEDKKGDDKKDDEKKENTPEIDALIGVLKTNLEGVVKDVRLSNRLTDSAVCLVADDGDMDIHLQRILQQHQQLQETSLRVLEINADHALIKAVAAAAAKDGSVNALKDSAQLLLDQARIMEGELPEDPTAFAQRLSAVMTQSLK
ncbi:molecular chaperone HtpG [Paremcibacter congregatus]|uniref:Chaperone protein HtpG n=1 Tax=Paremcibacter congregatus TaxID=2043170 RepID=A0A2G4YST4_9PROT|nr:molecular chaperone HtpG [Paremcibacter congregatus]PHZ84506.1 molecular chaperone HtpG [Paremcibacter congregatus]QDE28725.1 molecular chaperone HtpG [Paremcibacter congregatus]